MSRFIKRMGGIALLALGLSVISTSPGSATLELPDEDIPIKEPEQLGFKVFLVQGVFYCYYEGFFCLVFPD